MQPTSNTPATRRLNLRGQLILALSIPSLLLLIIIVTSLLSIIWVRRAANQAVAIDSRLSRLASEVALQTMICRRYEKDLFIGIDDPQGIEENLRKWNSSYGRLQEAIAEFGAAVTSQADQEQHQLWLASSANYQTAFLIVVQGIREQTITSARTANVSLTPYEQSIRSLVDTATKTAEAKAAAARQAEGILESSTSHTIVLLSVLAALALVGTIGWSVLFPTRIMRPIAILRAAASRLASGDLASRVQMERTDEIGDLAQSFNHMAETIEQRTLDLQTQYKLAQDARLEAEAAHTQIAEQLKMIEQQRNQIIEMSVPILPVTDTTMVMPLVGILDDRRLSQIEEHVLRTIEQSQARCLIIDITGVPIVDTQVAQGLIQIMRASELLGTEIMLVGIRPEVAQAIVGLGIGLQGIVTHSTLQSGIDYAMQSSVNRY